LGGGDGAIYVEKYCRAGQATDEDELPSYSTRSATLLLSEPLPTTTTGYHML